MTERATRREAIAALAAIGGAAVMGRLVGASARQRVACATGGVGATSTPCGALGFAGVVPCSVAT